MTTARLTSEDLTVGNRFSLHMWLCVVTFCSLVIIPGYRSYLSDQLIYLTDIFGQLDPALYQKDFLRGFQFGGYTVFDELTGACITFLGKDALVYVLFVVTVLFRYLFYYATFRLAHRISGNILLSCVVLIFFLFDIPVFQTGIFVMSRYLVPRFMSITAGLLSLTYMMEKKYLPATILICTGVLFHPVSIIPFILILLFDHVAVLRETRLNKFTLSVGLPFIPLFVLLVMVFRGACADNSAVTLFSRIDSVWESVIRTRNWYSFISEWTWDVKTGILFGSHIIFYFIVRRQSIFRDRVMKRFFDLSFLVPLSLFCVSFMTADLFKISLGPQLQLARSLVLWKIMFPVSGLAACWHWIVTREKTPFVSACILTVVIFLVYTIILAPRTGGYDNIRTHGVLILLVLSFNVLLLFKKGMLPAGMGKYITQKNEFRLLYFYIVLYSLVAVIFLGRFFSIQPSYNERIPSQPCTKWIRENTDTSDCFMLEPSGPGFYVRLELGRSVFVTYKDGAKSFFNRAYALEWKKRMEFITDFFSSSTELSIKGLYDNKIDYILVDRALETVYPLVYSDNENFVYRVKRFM